ncbi:hypothetical protein J4714_14115 [Staphylococcus epidermidis]|nr:hypothetical protein [Staphylococcus epidermidis]
MVRINDRGPFAPGRIIDLSKAAAQELGMLGLGIAGGAVAAGRGRGRMSRRSMPLRSATQCSEGSIGFQGRGIFQTSGAPSITDSEEKR